MFTMALEMEVECMASQLEADFWQLSQIQPGGRLVDKAKELTFT